MMLEVDAPGEASATRLFDSQGDDSSATCRTRKLAQTMAEHAPLGIGKAMTDFLAQAARRKPSLQRTLTGATP